MLPDLRLLSNLVLAGNRKMAGTDDYYVFLAIKQAVEDAWNFQGRKEIILDEILNRLPKATE